jgi:hypothetical protein
MGNCAMANARLMLAGMSRGRRFVARVLLLAAVLMAAQPLVLGLSLALATSANATDWGPIVICTGHGPVTLSQGGDGGAPLPRGQGVPDCPYCALGCNFGLTKVLPAASALQISLAWGVASSVPAPIAVIDVPRRILRLLTSPPRAPPHHA